MHIWLIYIQTMRTYPVLISRMLEALDSAKINLQYSHSPHNPSSFWGWEEDALHIFWKSEIVSAIYQLLDNSYQKGIEGY